MNAKIIKDGEVINTIVLPDSWTGAPDEWQPEEGCIVEPIEE